MGRFVTSGIAAAVSSSEVEINELPIGRWTSDYKQFLLRLCEDSAATGVLGFKEHHTADHPRFVVKMHKKALKEVLQGTRVGSGSGSGGSGAAAEGDLDYFDDGSGSVEERRLGRYFRLETTVAMGNMTAFGPDGRTLKRYASAADILEDYYPVRLAL